MAMATPPVAPSLYLRAVTDTMVFRPGKVFYHRILQTARSHNALEHSAPMDWVTLSQLFPPRHYLMPRAAYGEPARLEFFWDEGKLESGVAIFDAQRRLIVHSIHALLGTTSNIKSEAELSTKLMRRLEIDDETVHAAHQSVGSDRFYQLIISRETGDGHIGRSWWWQRIR